MRYDQEAIILRQPVIKSGLNDGNVEFHTKPLALDDACPNQLPDAAPPDKYYKNVAKLGFDPRIFGLWSQITTSTPQRTSYFTTLLAPYINKSLTGLTIYTKPTIHSPRHPLPWTTATVLDFIRYLFNFDMPFLELQNYTSYYQKNQALLKNKSVA